MYKCRFYFKDENQQWFDDMKNLVEDTYTQCGEQRITLLVHSMGGPMSLVFLQKQTKEWKDKYIEQVISLAGAWAGMDTVQIYFVFLKSNQLKILS